MTIDLGDRPRRTAPIPTRVSEDGSVMVNHHQQVMQLNSTATALWSLCDGETSVSEIITAATSLFSSPTSRIESEILAVLDELRLQELIEC
jgi:hypothetical protein